MATYSLFDENPNQDVFFDLLENTLETLDFRHSVRMALTQHEKSDFLELALMIETDLLTKKHIEIFINILGQLRHLMNTLNIKLVTFAAKDYSAVAFAFTQKLTEIQALDCSWRVGEVTL